MGWLFVPVSEGWNSASQASCPTTEPCASWRGKFMPLRFWSRAWQRASWLRLLSGMTLPPSAATSGVRSLISSLRDSRASRTASRGSGAGSPTSVGSGPTSLASFARYDLGLCSWRTCQGSLPLAGLTPASVIWPRAGSMRSGIASARQTSAHRTSGSVCSSWPTATTADADRASGTYARGNQTLVGAVRGWPPALAMDGYNQSEGPNAAVRPGLGMLAKTWATPLARDHRGPGVSVNREGTPPLSYQVLKNWQTPRVATGAYTRDDGQKGRERLSLEGEAKTWPTPRASENENRTTKHQPSVVAGRRGATLSGEAHEFRSRQDPPATGVPTFGTGLALNPQFVEALMGWPIGWTACVPVEMALWLQPRPSPSRRLHIVLERPAPKQGSLL